MNVLEQAEKVITTPLMQLVDYEGEPIACITPETPLFATQHFDGIKYRGWNLYAVVGEEMQLIETYDDTDEITGKQLADNVIESIKDGFAWGVEYYEIPANN